ncbi:MAG: PilZ domain-containing protein [Bdellovibrionales bacterium]|nr:PilZ domain-containing protein [Bdellovibrionales bacterium]
MEKKSSDRRKRLRVPVQSRIKHSFYQVLGTPIFEENSSVDLSSNGISFETAREYQKGALILLEVHIGEEALKLLVCVAWVKSLPEGVFQVGAELVAVDPVHKRKMLNHLNKLIQSIQPKSRSKKKPTAKKSSKKQAAKRSAVKKKSSRKTLAKKARKKTGRKR